MIQADGPAGALRLPRFLARYPEALRTIPANAPALRPPSSYAGIAYHGQHAYKWIDRKSGERYVRYTLTPFRQRKGQPALRGNLCRAQYTPGTIAKPLAQPGRSASSPVALAA